MVSHSSFLQAVAMLAGECAGSMPNFHLRSRGHDVEVPSLTWRPGETVKHFRNRLMNRRNPNRTCKLLRRIKTTC